jgi:Protein of unknown function (DUF1569)
MPTLFDPAARAGIRARVDRLTPESPRQWGKMSIGEMVVHVSRQLRLALGELPCEPRKTPFRNPLLKRLIIYLLPWPKGTPTAPELLQGVPGTWNEDVDALRTLIDRFGARGPAGEFPEHPAFGRLNGRMWGVLGWRHLDHHLRQFGV